MTKNHSLAVILLAAFVFLPIDQAVAKGSSAGKSGRTYSAHSSPRIYSKKSAVVGIYKFTSSNGKQYIGKSIDVARRLKEHIRSGKLKKSNIGRVTVEKYDVSNRDLSTIEKAKIRTADIINRHGLANKQNAPFSRGKEKAVRAFNERKQKIKEKVSDILKRNPQ